MTPALEVPALAGRLVRLEPLAEAHVDGLAAASAENRDTYGYATVPRGRDTTVDYVRTLLASRSVGETIPFVQLRVADSLPVGVTRFLNLRRRPGVTLPYAVEIGGTWLAASAQRTGINSEAKFLLLVHAFEVWKVQRVDFKTDARNSRSRSAILALGASFEGVLRNWQPSNVADEQHQLRDSAYYSMLDWEWPAARRTLLARLQ